MSRSNFSPTGLKIGENTANLTYLYGISDFFTVMFEDPSRVNLLLESGAEAASAVYSKFLQLTSTISLEDIQNTLGQSIKLVTIQSTDAVPNETNVYSLSEKIVETRYIANKPFLPTTLLETDVDFRIELTKAGTYQIRFARDISTAGFATRLLSDESTKEYAFWFVDSEVDEGWINDHYANLIGVDPQTSTDAFKNFVYGLYYIYINGPTLELLRKGLNLCLGVPLARDVETVLEIRTYLETDQYIVVTDLNQYLLPFGLDPKVVEGDNLNVGDELAQWVEVKDYINDGEWWINLMIPSTIIPVVPEGQVNRYATEGSHFDYLMRQYLKKHTFLVNVKVQDFKNNQVFQQLSDIIRRAKPSYTQAVYIWTIPQLEEEFSIEEDLFIQRRDISRCDNITLAIEKMYRANNRDPLVRGCPTFMRDNVPHFVSKLCGTDPYCNGNPMSFQGGTSIGFINGQSQYRAPVDTEKAWLRTINERGSERLNMSRSKIGFSRGTHSVPDAGVSYRGFPVHTVYSMANINPIMRVMPIYITTQKDIEYKCLQLGIKVPDMVEWTFDIFNPLSVSEEINALAINEGLVTSTTSLLSDNYDLLMNRGSDVYYFSNIMPELAFRTYLPAKADITMDDYLVGIRIYDKVIGIYWVTSNTNVLPDPYAVVEENDQLTLEFTAPPTRGLGPTSSSYYLVRGRGALSYNNVRSEINAGTINDAETVEQGLLDTQFSDLANPIPVYIVRNGANLAHRTELK